MAFLILIDRFFMPFIYLFIFYFKYKWQLDILQLKDKNQHHPNQHQLRKITRRRILRVANQNEKSKRNKRKKLPTQLRFVYFCHQYFQINFISRSSHFSKKFHNWFIIVFNILHRILRFHEIEIRFT